MGLTTPRFLYLILGKSIIEPSNSNNAEQQQMDIDVDQGVDGIKAYGIEKLIQLAASQLSDQLPESREAAHALLKTLKQFTGSISVN
ncbi:hypothetical protein K7X08_023782 [Anisodus acutangulus]|uniref:Uncharacterized protein n=1 Tax=Anisodus acutangulus TaxID=402998 RepID=A0A9Q1LAP8_9SOLA|nr:hypothetical protein K7X08_023782 [Anisodus acutangulus]